MKLIALVAAQLLVLGGVAAAQGNARFQLVRCTAGSDSPCLRTVVQFPPAQRGPTSGPAFSSAAANWVAVLPGNRLVPKSGRGTVGDFVGARSFAFGLAGDVSSLARMPAVGSIIVRAGPDTLAWSRIEWRPPLIATPGFQGIADSAALGPGLRDAMILGISGTDDTPMIAVLLATIIACGWVLLFRLGWTEPVVVPRERSPGSPPSLVAPPPPAAEPRRPEDITHQTARHTAMHR